MGLARQSTNQSVRNGTGFPRCKTERRTVVRSGGGRAGCAPASDWSARQGRWVEGTTRHMRQVLPQFDIRQANRRSPPVRRRVGWPEPEPSPDRATPDVSEPFATFRRLPRDRDHGAPGGGPVGPAAFRVHRALVVVAGKFWKFNESGRPVPVRTEGDRALRVARTGNQNGRRVRNTAPCRLRPAGEDPSPHTRRPGCRLIQVTLCALEP